MKITSWGASDVGQSRKVNEDAFLLAPELGLVAVADGMGGFQRGDVASQVAVNVVKETVATHRHVIELYKRDPGDASRGAIRALLENALQRACDEVYEAAVAITGEGGRMGTTMDVLLVVGTTAFIAHVGDGRIYLQRGSEVHQLTEDHSLVQQQLKDGTLTPDEARHARFKNVITRALGVFPSVQVDSLHFELDAGDRMLMCSDGLYRYIGLREIGFSLARDLSADSIGKLIQQANDRGGRDNITGVLCLFELEATGEFIAPTRARMEVLRKVDLFQYCTYRELISICQVATSRVVEADTLLFREGEAGRELFVLVAGAVAIEKGRTQLAVMRPADYFGEMSLIDQPRRSADARTLERTEFLVIDRDRFVQLMKQDSDLASKLMWQLLQKLSRLVRLTSEKLVSDTVDDLVELDGHISIF